jgi:hypothetical protein
MKITDAWIHDPSLFGEYKPAEMCVQVDEAPDVSIAPETFANGWTVGKYGPFVKYVAPDNKDATAIDFNLAFRDRLPMVIDIVLIVGEDNEMELPFSLPLARARQLIKKHSPDWRLLISDREAVHGNLVWRPVQLDPPCRGNHGVCGRRPASPVRTRGIEIPLCQEHMKQFNSAQAQARASSSK